MGGGVTSSRKSQSRIKQRTRDFPGLHNRWKQTDPPWRPEDDYLLIHSIFVTCNLAEVHACVRFTKPYTETEIENRWRLLLFNPEASKTSREAILSIPQIVKRRLDAKIPFSGEEDSILMTIPFSDVYKEGVDKYSAFEKLLLEHPRVFYASRTPLHLYSQWNRLRSCHLISEETKNRSSDVGGDPESFSDTEFIIQETTARVMQAGLPHVMESSNIARRKRLLASADTYHGFQASVSHAVADSLVKRQRSNTMSKSCSLGTTNRFSSQSSNCTGRRSETPEADRSESSSFLNNATSLARCERYRARRRLHAKMMRTEEEARRWTALVECKVANGIIISDHQPIYPTLATLTGKRSRFLIKCKNATFGRPAHNFVPDIDLSCEGESLRVSRRHGRICLADNGVFWLTNLSKHPIIVDGDPILKDKKCQLHDKSIVCISQLSFRFDVEHDHLSMLSGLERSIAGGDPSILDRNHNDKQNQKMRDCF